MKVFAVDVLTKGADYLVLPVYLYFMSQKEYGFYTYAIFVVTTLSGILKMGLDTALSKMYFEDHHKGRLLFTVQSMWVLCYVTVAGLSLFTSLGQTVFTQMFSMPLADFENTRLFLFLYILYHMVQTSLNVFFVIDKAPMSYQKANLVKTVVTNLVLIGLMYLGGQKTDLLRLTYEPLISFVVFLPLIWRIFRLFSFQIDWAVVRKGLSIGLPMMGTLIVGAVYNLSDKYFLQKTLGFEALATYNLAFFLCLPISLIFSSFQTIWFPEFAQEKNEEIRLSKSQGFSRRLMLVYAGVLVLSWVGLALALRLGLIQNAYQNILIIFPFIFVAKVAENISQIYNNFIVIWGKTLFNLVVSLVFALLTFLLNYYLIPKGGIAVSILILILVSMVRYLTYRFYVRYRTSNM